MRLLNGVQVDTISEELSDKEVWKIQKLDTNLGRMFQGTILSGEGFKITADTARSLLSLDDEYNKVVFPFIGGNEINGDPICKPICWVICFWDWPEERAKKFAEAFSIIQSAVQPERQRRKANGDYKYRDPQPQRWWQYGEKRPALYHAVGRGHVFENHSENWNSDAPQLARALVVSTGTTKYPAFTFLSSKMMYSNKLCILADDRYSIFAILSSDIHNVWAWARKTTLQADMESMRYAHGNIFETFPFPAHFLNEGSEDLERIGEAFFKARQLFMEKHSKGLTKFYNDFHNQKKSEEDLVALRHLQMQMNEFVCRQYDWDDLDLACGFHEVGYLPEGRNMRFTVSEQARLEILRHLSRLNRERYESQLSSGSVTKSRRNVEPPDTDLTYDDDDLFSFLGDADD